MTSAPLALLPLLARVTGSAAICGILVLSLSAPFSAQANGINRDSVGARSISLRGASVVDENDAFASMAINSALLNYVQGFDIALSVIGVIADGGFKHQYGDQGYLDDSKGVFSKTVVRYALSDDLPQPTSGGSSWQLAEKTRLAIQVDWVAWAEEQRATDIPEALALAS